MNPFNETHLVFFVFLSDKETPGLRGFTGAEGLS
jgi:hypothetical protein